MEFSQSPEQWWWQHITITGMENWDYEGFPLKNPSCLYTAYYHCCFVSSNVTSFLRSQEFALIILFSLWYNLTYINVTYLQEVHRIGSHIYTPGQKMPPANHAIDLYLEPTIPRL